MKGMVFKGFINFCLCVACCTCFGQTECELQEGDLLFQHLNCGDLCIAIESVTEGVYGKDFSHCAMVVKVHDTLKVVEAIGNKVQINDLNVFFARSGDTVVIRNITIGRVKKQYAKLIPKAVQYAKQQAGVPYDDDFLPDNGKLYCSELIYQAFKDANNGQDFFSLQPMTYKDPVSKEYFPVWVSYFKALNTPIPEGVPGINPGLISRSSKIGILNCNHITIR